MPDDNRQLQVIDNVTWREINNELVVLDLASGKYLTFNTVGRDVWKGIVEEKSVDEIVELIQSEYLVNQETARKDVQAFVNLLIEKKLVTAA